MLCRLAESRAQQCPAYHVNQADRVRLARAALAECIVSRNNCMYAMQWIGTEMWIFRLDAFTKDDIMARVELAQINVVHGDTADQQEQHHQEFVYNVITTVLALRITIRDWMQQSHHPEREFRRAYKNFTPAKAQEVSAQFRRRCQ